MFIMLQDFFQMNEIQRILKQIMVLANSATVINIDNKCFLSAKSAY